MKIRRIDVIVWLKIIIMPSAGKRQFKFVVLQNILTLYMGHRILSQSIIIAIIFYKKCSIKCAYRKTIFDP